MNFYNDMKMHIYKSKNASDNREVHNRTAKHISINTSNSAAEQPDFSRFSYKDTRIIFVSVLTFSCFCCCFMWLQGYATLYMPNSAETEINPGRKMLK